MKVFNRYYWKLTVCYFWQFSASSRSVVSQCVGKSPWYKDSGFLRLGKGSRIGLEDPDFKSGCDGRSLGELAVHGDSVGLVDQHLLVSVQVVKVETLKNIVLNWLASSSHLYIMSQTKLPHFEVVPPAFKYYSSIGDQSNGQQSMSRSDGNCWYKWGEYFNILKCRWYQGGIWHQAPSWLKSAAKVARKSSNKKYVRNLCCEWQWFCLIPVR